jgi:outer membrane protein TolC
MPALGLDNSKRIEDLISSGRLRLSLSDALALAIENNLDIAVQRFIHPVAEADVLRTSSGQAARGVPGALLPSGLSQGALGVGVNQAAGVGGVGAAGGISGGGGSVSVPQVGTFDPAVSINSSWDRTVAPLNSTVVAGVPQVTVSSAATSVTYTQLLSQGSSFTFGVNGIAQNSTQHSLLFNPAVVSRLALGFNQPLLNGFGSVPNQRFLIVARNNLQISDQLFREQITSTIVQIEDAYWDLAAARQAIASAQSALDAARQLVQDTRTRVQFGTAAPLDVIGTEAAAASAERDRIIAETTFQQQEAQLKTLLTKRPDPRLDAADIDTTDVLPDPSGRPLPDLSAALRSAMSHRPELAVADKGLENQDVTVQFTRNGLLPNVSAFALYAGAGLTGDVPPATDGVGGALLQSFNASFPEYAAGISATIPIRNRSAQADNLRARLEAQQLGVQEQRSRQQIGLEVRQAVISLTQGLAQIEASREAVRLAQETVNAEREKLTVGVSNAYDVILRERDLLAARQTELATTATYAKALVDFDRATGLTLEQNGILLSDALEGEPRKAPTPSSVRPANTDLPR